MHIIITDHPSLGRGYYTGNKKGCPCFQKCYDRSVKDYRTLRGAEKQLARIKAAPGDEGETYGIKSIFALGLPPAKTVPLWGLPGSVRLPVKAAISSERR